MMRKLGDYLTPWSVLGGIGILALLLAVLGLILRSLVPVQPTDGNPTAVVLVIAAPTATPLSLPTFRPSPTPKLELSTPAPNAQIKVGDYVQITGTGGDGLRVRSGAGIQNAPLFLGMESEVFQVTDGPKEADGITWWFLVAPYDENRKGWAASNYLAVVAKRP
jgi:hypothetical protein